MKCDMNKTNQDFYEIEKSLIELSHANYHSILTNIESLYNEKLERNYVLNKDKVEKYKMFPYLINHAQKYKNDDIFYKFCSLFYLLNKNSYSYLQRLLPILSPTSCRYFISPLKNSLNFMIQNKEYIIAILEIYYNGLIEFENHMAKDPMIVTLCGDAASLKASKKSPYQAVYVFHFLPCNGQLPPAAINMMPCKNGPSSSEGVKKFIEITAYLKKLGFKVQYPATDGDISFDFLHNDFFGKHIESILNKNFKEILDICSELETIPLSDPFHIFKGEEQN